MAGTSVPGQPVRAVAGGRMGRTLCSGMILLLAAGCMSAPPVEAPLPPVAGMPAPPPNLLYVPQAGPEGYGMVFENVITALKESGFDIVEANRYDGRIDTFPRVAPGVGRFFLPGSPVFSERVLATLQSYRHRASVKIYPADNGGFFVQVTVFRELEDLPRPVRTTAGAAFYQAQNNVDRVVEVIDPTLFESNWIPRGRDTSFEQLILQRVKARLM